MILRLTTALSIVDNAGFLRKVYNDMAMKKLIEMSFESFLKKLCLCAPHKESSYIAFSGNPADCFVFFVETTKPFDDGKVFTAECFYHETGDKELTQGLLTQVEQWASPATLVIPTKRDSGAAVRFFKKLGFYKKEINFQRKV